MAKMFRNDDDRLAFLDAFKDSESEYFGRWVLWKEDRITGRRWWTTHIQTTIFIVEEVYQSYSWPKPHKEWRTMHWYVYEGPMTDAFTGEMTFEDRRSSRSLALKRIKELEKGGEE